MRFDRITMNYGKRRTIFADFSLELTEGQITCVMGASGIGKTTLLRLALGLERPAYGAVHLRADACIGCVFQEPRLLPGKTVLENVRWVLERSDRPGKGTDGKALDLLKEAGLAHAVSDYPDQLSGGMKQRVSLVRAFVSDPTLLIMDEPFQSLDAAAKKDMQTLLLRLWHKKKPMVLLVTHDLEEALALGSRIVVLGGSPAEIVEDIKAAGSAGGPQFSPPDKLKLEQMSGA
ncbi:ABC transporter ATP-binding protein [Paenibacillus ehimensis]|uniref:ABC transporter ATP-binding protein n=1 Tax=Paenibacillus ehimensis TaxID=79264 RepID=UPI00046EF766|nr:ABC transporter ATP-binding protein [Paenibacillus ehimensis]